MAYPNSYCAATAKGGETFDSLHGDLEVETCVIGRGYAGFSTALGLVERGHTDVAVIDAEDIGFGCSGRNGGFAFGGFSLHEHGLMQNRMCLATPEVHDTSGNSCRG